MSWRVFTVSTISFSSGTTCHYLLNNWEVFLAFLFIFWCMRCMRLSEAIMLTLEDDRNNRINFDEFPKMFNKMSEHSRNYWYFFMLRDQHASERLENFKFLIFFIFCFSSCVQQQQQSDWREFIFVCLITVINIYNLAA